MTFVARQARQWVTLLALVRSTWSTAAAARFDGGVEGDRVWMTCSCRRGAGARRGLRLDSRQPSKQQYRGGHHASAWPICVLFIASPAFASDSEQRLLGVWKVESWYTEFKASGEKKPPLRREAEWLPRLHPREANGGASHG